MNFNLPLATVMLAAFKASGLHYGGFTIQSKGARPAGFEERDALVLELARLKRARRRSRNLAALRRGGMIGGAA